VAFFHFLRFPSHIFFLPLQPIWIIEASPWHSLSELDSVFGLRSILREEDLRGDG
jgi:hypothetical protein